MSTAQTETPEAGGVLPGRFEFVREPSYFGIPTDPEWNRPSDIVRSFNAGPGMAYAAQTQTGSMDPFQHFRGMEDPSLSIGYDLQQEMVDGSGNAVDPSADVVLRDSENQLANTLLWQHRLEHESGGNDDAGVRLYTVARGCKGESAEATLDPTAELPILMETTWAPRKVRSYAIHQPSSSTTLEVTSTSANDTMDMTVENEGAGTTETITLTGTNAASGATSFTDIDSIWLASAPEGDVTVADGSGTTIMEIEGGNTMSSDNAPVDGDRGVPSLGGGSHAAALGSSYEHFLGDTFERGGSDIRARLISGSWSVENDFDDGNVHTSRHPVVDEGDRTVTVDTDVAGKTVSHQNFVEHLTKDIDTITHTLDSTQVSFINCKPVDIDERTVDPEQARAEYNITWEASSTNAITLSQPP